MVSVRPATTDDLTGVAKVHVDSWRVTYRGIVPQEYLDGLSYERSRERRAQELEEEKADRWLYVAVDEANRVIGFASFGAARGDEPGYDAEIYAIYRHPDAVGLGIGRAMFEAAVRTMLEAGMRSMIIWALEANPSCGFYDRMGGTIVTRKMIKIGGEELPEVGYGWPTMNEVQR